MDYDFKLRFLEKCLGESKYSQSNKEALFFCPFCFHHKKKLSVNLETDHFQCWVCRASGKKLNFLLYKTGNKHLIEEYCGRFLSKSEEASEQSEEQSEFSVRLPREYRFLLDSKESHFGKYAYKYLLSRGLSDREIVRHKIGLCESGPFFKRLIVPSFDRFGVLNFFVGRDFSGTSELKYMNPYDLPKNYKNTIIINELNVDYSLPIVVVEGFFDMFKSISNTVPLCGSTLSKESLLFQNIVRNNSEVVICLDGDAKNKAFYIVSNFLKYDVKVSYVDVVPFKDVGAMTREEFLQKYSNRQIVDEKFLLLEKLKKVS